ncbi:MAG: tocopherol cyclase family protein [archaeon]|nr:tocopherol cyclase family protein [archaeon]
MFNKYDEVRNRCMLTGKYKKQGYDWWWHSLTAVNDATGEERPFFFEYYGCNPGISPDECVFGQAEESKANGLRPSYYMVKAGTWLPGGCQLHRFFPWKDVKMKMGAPFSVECGDCYCDEKQMRGSIHVSKEDVEAHPEWLCVGYGDLEWDIKMEKKITFNVGWGTNGFFTRIKAFEMFWHAQGIKTEYSGYVTYNGQRYTIKPESCNGYMDKNWGKDFTTPWVWLSSNDLVSKKTGKRLTNSALEIGGGKPKCGPIVLDGKLLGCLYYEGEEYEFNFSKFWTGSKTLYRCGENKDQIVWHVDQKTRKGRLVSNFRCEKKDMLLVQYEAPNGTKYHNRLWNGGTGYGTITLYDKKGEVIDEIEVKRMGCEYGVYDGNPMIVFDETGEKELAEVDVSEVPKKLEEIYGPGDY